MALAVKNPPDNAGDISDAGPVPGWGRFLGGGHGDSPQYSRREIPTDRGGWQAIQSMGLQRVGHNDLKRLSL